VASNYPTALDSFSTAHIAGETIQAGTDNDQADALNKIEAELGVKPSGTSATVKARLDATDAALALKAPLASPALTGTPTAPTATPGTNSTQLATTAFVLANGAGGGIPTSLLNAKGDLIVASAASTAARLPVGANNQLLRADSTLTLGMAWVDDVAATITVRAASTANVTIPPGGTSLSIGSVTLANGETALLKDQTSAAENGVYVVGGVGTSVTLTRVAELDVSAEFAPGLVVFVREGAHRGTMWALVNQAPNPTVGTTAIYFTRVHPNYRVASDMGNQLAFFTGIMESHNRQNAHLVTSTITSGTVYVQPLGVLRAGHTLSSVMFCAGSTAAVSPTNQWAGVCNASRVIRGISADATTAAWGAFSTKTFTLAAAYTAPFDELLYSFVMVAATTPPSLVCSNMIASGLSAAGSSNTAQTTPPANGTTLNALTGRADNIYCGAA
jgi:hypothetical protein